MPVKDRMASLRKSLVTDGEEIAMSTLIIPTTEEETTEEFLRRVASVRETITEMESVVDLIRQLHCLLKFSNKTPDVDRARLRLLYEKLSEIIASFSKDLDRAVEAVNGFHDEVKKSSNKKSAHYRMRKNQTEGLKKTLHSVLLRFRSEEVPFEQQTKPAAEKHLREFNMKPATDLSTLQVPGKEITSEDNDPTSRRLSRGMEIGDLEKGEENARSPLSFPIYVENASAQSLQCVEVDEQEQNKGEKAALIEIKQRNEELQLLEKAVSSVSALHEHLNFLVHTQSSVMDRIDTNISQAAEYTEKIMKETDEAVQLSRAAKEKQFLVLFFIAILVFLLLLTLFTFVKVWVFGVVP